MPTEYERIREILSQGFSANALREIARTSLALLQDPATDQPAAFLFIATVSQWIADAWDERPIEARIVARVEKSIRPHFESLLAIEKGESADYVKILLDAAAIAFRNVLRSGLDSDLV